MRHERLFKRNKSGCLSATVATETSIRYSRKIAVQTFSLNQFFSVKKPLFSKSIIPAIQQPEGVDDFYLFICAIDG